MNQMPFRGDPVTVPLIELDDIGKTYVTGGDVRVEALKGISLNISEPA